MAEHMVITEKQLSDNIVNLARMLGWLVHRDPTWRATGTDPGYPDLTLVARDGRIIFAELKTDKGKLTDAQEDWGRALTNYQANFGVNYYLWRPSNWYAGEVEKVLS